MTVVRDDLRGSRGLEAAPVKPDRTRRMPQWRSGGTSSNKPDHVRQEARHDEERAGHDEGVAVEQRLERQLAFVHGSEHAPDHGEALLADHEHAEDGGSDQEADGRPETDRFPGFDKKQ